MTRRQKTVSKILEVKGFTKERLEAEAGKALARLKEEEAKLDALDADFKKSSADLTAKQMKGDIPLQQIDLYYAYLKRLGNEMEQQKRVIAQRAAELEKARTALLGAHREKKLIEILHGRLEKERIKEMDQVEQKAADYTFLSRKAER